MKKRGAESHWGEFPDFHRPKVEVENCLAILSPEKRAKLENIGAVEEKSPPKSLIIENHLITQTIELMNHTDRIKSMIEAYNDEMAYMAHQRRTLPTITLSAETRACLDELNHPIISPLQSRLPPSDFCQGKPKCNPKISKPVALEAICKSLSGMLRVKGFHDCTESALLMFMDGVDEFFKSFMETINNVVTVEEKDLNKTIDILTLEKAYFSLTQNSLTNLHNYYKNEVINRNRNEILNFMNTQQHYEKLVEESENIQKINLKEEYMHLMNNGGSSQPRNLSPASSNMNDSDASSFSFKDSNFSFDTKQQSDDNTNLSFSISQ